jgi:hypothetical protein
MNEDIPIEWNTWNYKKDSEKKKEEGHPKN